MTMMKTSQCDCLQCAIPNCNTDHVATPCSFCHVRAHVRGPANASPGIRPNLNAPLRKHSRHAGLQDFRHKNATVAGAAHACIVHARQAHTCALAAMRPKHVQRHLNQQIGTGLPATHTCPFAHLPGFACVTKPTRSMATPARVPGWSLPRSSPRRRCGRCASCRRGGSQSRTAATPAAPRPCSPPPRSVCAWPCLAVRFAD